MNFKLIGLKVAAATAVVSGAASMTSAPAQALSLANGSVLNFSGSVVISQGTGEQYLFDFLAGGSLGDPGTPGDVSIGLSLGSFSSATGGSGGAKLTDLATVSTASGYTAPPVGPFLKNVKLADGQVVDFILGSISGASQFTLNGNGFNFLTFDGSFTDGVGTVLGSGALTAQFTSPVFVGTTTYSASIEVIPTPAMLPGMIGFGLAALRKRKAETTADSEA